MSIRVFIVDDSNDFLTAATSLLQRDGLAVAGVATSSDAAALEVGRLRPDVVLVDIMLADESGIDLADRLLDEGHLANGSSVILTSTHSEGDLVDLIAASAARGFVPKAELSGSRIREILGGATRID